MSDREKNIKWKSKKERKKVKGQKEVDRERK